MIRLTKLTDYGVALLAYFAAEPRRPVLTARGLAEESKLPLATVSKILKVLSRVGLLVSHRGVKGGYSLAREPGEISITDVIVALDGPLGLTQCTIAGESSCSRERICPTHAGWQTINDTVLGALSTLSLADLAEPDSGNGPGSGGAAHGLVQLTARGAR